MLRTVTLSLPALFVAGCLSSAPKPPTSWNIDADTGLVVSSVEVVAPYDGVRFAVLRPDGSVAFDGLNTFSARPASLIRSAVKIVRSGPALTVRRLALDCTKEGERKALVELVLDAREGAPEIRASASVDTSGGNYARAFGEAFAAAVKKLEHGGR